MTTRPIIAVVGATGAQGSGLARALLADPSARYAVRAITRDPLSPAARALSDAGAEVVRADIDDEASLVAALRGAFGAFFVTFYWAHGSPEREFAQARTMASAARTTDVQHVIWSTLEDTRQWLPLTDARMPTLHGRYNVPHMDAKGEANRWFAELGVPTTFLYTSFYWENLIAFGMGPRQGPDGNLMFTLPMGDATLPGIAADDIGRCALGVFAAGTEYIGRHVGIAGEHLTGTEMASRLGEAMGYPVRYNAISPAQYRDIGFPGADDLGNMFHFKRDFQSVICGTRDVAVSRRLNPALQSFDEWLVTHAGRIPIEMAAH